MPVNHKVDLLPICNADESVNPRCSSPLTKINPSPLDIATPSIDCSPSPANESPKIKNELVNRKCSIYLTNSCNNLGVNGVLGTSFTKSLEEDKKIPPALNLSPDEEVINRSCPRRFVKLLDSIESRPRVFEHLCAYIKDAWAFIFAPASVIYQSMVRLSDVNPLHGPEFSGHKVVSWFFDSHHDKSENLLSTIKRIKTRIPEAKFSDVVLSAISSSLESYFLRSGCEGKSMPESVSVVIPGRMTTRDEMALTDKTPSQEESIKIPALENKFSVALLSLPLTPKIAKSFSPIGRLREVCKQTDLMRASRDYLINYWLMRVVPAYLPLPLLAPVLDSVRSTVVFSNLVGPTSQLELGGFLLKDIVFWVPNRGATGVGVSVLSYSGRLQIGITADSALLTSQQDANIIIEGIISELKCLDKITAPIKTQPLKV